MRTSQRTRRQFVVASGAALAAHTSTGAPVMKTGRIDCQSHLFSEEFLKFLETRKTSPYAYRKGGQRFVVVGEWHRSIMPHHTDVAAKLADMDAAGIERTAISINDPGPELFGNDSPAMARMLNDFIADVVRQNPKRFFGLAVLPFNTPDAMLAELERSTTRLGVDRRVTILIEPLAPHLCNVVNTLEEAAGIVKRIGSPAVQSMFDTHNTAGEKLPADKLLEKFISCIRHVHLNELDGKYPGAGNYDFEIVLKTLRRLGYKGWLSVEVFDFKPDGETVARKAFQFIRQIEDRTQEAL